jgi:ER lumen protein retaining receptor
MLANFIKELTRFSADAIHLYTMILLIHKIRNTRSCSGLSYKTQLLYMIVFACRYSDIIIARLNRPLRIYNFFMKIAYLSVQAFILFLIRVKYFYTYDKHNDSFNVSFLILPCVIAAFICKIKTHGMFAYLIEYNWCFSVLLECVAILPQLVLLQETGEAEVLTSRYIFFLGLYRALYVLGWIVKKASGTQVDFFLLACGVIQTILYADFFVLYYKFVFSRRGKVTKIPQ